MPAWSGQASGWASCRRWRRWVRRSSAAEAPGAGPVLVDEKAKWDLGAEHNAYATSKYLAELEVWRGVSEGLQAVMVNPSVMLGPADWEP